MRSLGLLVTLSVERRVWYFGEILRLRLIYESFVKGGHSQFFSRKKVTGNTSACRPYF